MITVLSLMYISPKAQVSPKRHSRAMAPITQDLTGERNYLQCHVTNVYSVSRRALCLYLMQSDMRP